MTSGHESRQSTIPQDLLDILVCPACKKPLTLQQNSLKCDACCRVYPIRDGIPVLLVDQATIAKS